MLRVSLKLAGRCELGRRTPRLSRVPIEALTAELDRRGMAVVTAADKTKLDENTVIPPLAFERLVAAAVANKTSTGEPQPT